MSLFFPAALKHDQAVLALFNSPVSEDEKRAAAEGEAKISLQDVEQLASILNHASLNGADAKHEVQQEGAKLDSAAAALSYARMDVPAGASASSPSPASGPGLMSSAAAVHRCSIQKWMQVSKNIQYANRAHHVSVLLAAWHDFAPQSTASQFTEYGHRQLKFVVRPNELFVLFRNNHFR